MSPFTLCQQSPGVGGPETTRDRTILGRVVLHSSVVRNTGLETEGSLVGPEIYGYPRA